MIAVVHQWLSRIESGKDERHALIPTSFSASMKRMRQCLLLLPKEIVSSLMRCSMIEERISWMLWEHQLILKHWPTDLKLLTQYNIQRQLAKVRTEWLQLQLLISLQRTILILAMRSLTKWSRNWVMMTTRVRNYLKIAEKQKWMVVTIIIDLQA